jgi:hypothetical protein
VAAGWALPRSEEWVGQLGCALAVRRMLQAKADREPFPGVNRGGPYLGLM